MSLTVGDRLGSFEILGSLGAGGMGEVYRARDRRLQREVAIKIMPEAFAADAERLARFEREAQVLASLNHPNIAAIYGIEDGPPAFDGAQAKEVAHRVRALVLELVEGPTLADRIAQGPLPLDEALPIARQIAEALEAAHEQGIVHRDLKPANIKLRPDGAVKVLDFGLAKALEPEVAAAGAMSLSPTITSPAATRIGVILGTAAYMSPEQARGKPVDKRSDVWAFGCVLYEMLTGTRAFDGDEVSDVLAAVLRAEPEVSKLPADTPPPVRRLVTRCLRKDRRDRLPDIGSARLEIADAADEPARTEAAIAPQARGGWKPWALVAATVALAVGGLVAIFLMGGEQQPQPIVRFQVFPPDGSSLVVGANGPAMALSPDGTQLAFVASSRGKPELLYVRRLDSTEPVPLPGTEGAVNPFWSPDSRSIGFFSGAQLKRVDITGGAPQIITVNPSGGPAGGVSTGTWGADGTILFQATGLQVLYRVNGNGGAAMAVTALDASRADIGHHWPRFLPDGRHFLYWANTGASEHRGIYVGDLDSSERRFVQASDFAADFAAPDRLLFRRGSTLFARSFDVRTLTATGEPVRIADPVGALTNLGRPGFSVSNAGVLAFWPVATSESASHELVIYDAAGRAAGSLGTALFRGIDVAPDNTRVAAHIESGTGGDIWLFDIERRSRQRFTFDSAQHSTAPVWSPDGRDIVFASLRRGLWGLYRKRANGTEREELLFESATPKAPSSYSPDGRAVLFTNIDANTGADIWRLPLDGDRTPVPLVQSRFLEQKGVVSPDGLWISYESNESGSTEAYVQGLAPQAGKWQVSTEGGFEPTWREDGRELHYGRQGEVFAVGVTRSAGALRFGNPRKLFEFRLGNPGHLSPYKRYAATADGQRFFVVQVPDVTDGSRVPLTVVLNWMLLEPEE